MVAWNAMRRLQWIVEFLIAWPWLALLQILPERLAFGLARRMGRAALFILRREHAWCLRQLELVYGDQMTPRQRKELSKRVFEHHGITICEILRMDKDWIARKVTVEGVERVSDLITHDKRPPVVVIGGHLGNWEVMGGYWKRLGMTSVMVSRPLDNPLLERLLQACRAKYCTETVSRKGVSMREGIRRLREGYGLGIAIDQNTVRNAVFVDFLGVPAATARGAAVIALKENARVILMTSYRREDGSHRIVLEPIDVVTTGDFENDVQTNMQNFTRAFGKWVLRHPDQWHWQHCRWRNRPDGTNWDLSVPMSTMLAERCETLPAPPEGWQISPSESVAPRRAA